MVVEAAGLAAFEKYEAGVFWVGVVDAEADGQDFGIEVEEFELEVLNFKIVEVSEVDFKEEGVLIHFQEYGHFVFPCDAVDVVAEVFDCEVVVEEEVGEFFLTFGFDNDFVHEWIWMKGFLRDGDQEAISCSMAAKSCR